MSPIFPKWALYPPAGDIPLASSVEDFLYISSEDPQPGPESRLAATSGRRIWDLTVTEFLHKYFSETKSLRWLNTAHTRLTSRAAITWIITSRLPHARYLDWDWAIFYARELYDDPGEFAGIVYVTLRWMVVSMEPRFTLPSVNPNLGKRILAMLQHATPENQATTEPLIYIRLAVDAASLVTTPLTTADIADALKSDVDPLQRMALFSLESLNKVPTLPTTLLTIVTVVYSAYITEAAFNYNDWFGSSILKILMAETLETVASWLPAKSKNHLISVLTSNVTLACILKACGHDLGKDEVQGPVERSAAHLRVLVSIAYQLCPEFARLWIQAVFGPLILDILRNCDDGDMPV